jgi:hypothetical protein
MSMTRPVEISIHVVSPVSIGILPYTKIKVIKEFGVIKIQRLSTKA